MDDLGNRTSVTLRDSTSDTYSVDTETNRYTSIDSASLAYDDAGNLTTDKDGYVYTYDDENRISQIKNSSDALIATFEYDALGRRVKVTDVVANTTTCYYYSDNWQVLAEHDGTAFTNRYVFGNYIDEVLVMNNGTNDYYYLHDHLYSAVALLNEAGSVVERYEYDAYGKATIWNAGLSTTYSISQYGNPYLFTGREVNYFDNGNLPLQDNRNRYLSQYMGRWYTHDPAEYVDGVNLYQYVINNPILYYDIMGLFFDSPEAMRYKYGISWPEFPAGYVDKWSMIQKMYKKDKLLLLLPWHLLNAGHIRTKSNILIAGAMLKGMQPAADYFNHYLLNTGTDQFFDVGQLIAEVDGARVEYESDLNEALTFAEDNVGYTFFSTTWPEREPEYNGVRGWEYAIQQYWAASRGKATCALGQYEMEYTYKIEDIYYWMDSEGGVGKYGIEVTHRELRQLHRYGLARMFKVHGREYTVKVRWKKGERLGSGAKIIEESPYYTF